LITNLGLISRPGFVNIKLSWSLSSSLFKLTLLSDTPTLKVNGVLGIVVGAVNTLLVCCEPVESLKVVSSTKLLSPPVNL
jgi:hypothetical protein